MPLVLRLALTCTPSYFKITILISIQVYVKEPLPVTTERGGAAENTLFLLDLLQQQQRKENEEKKVKSFI